MLRNIIVLPDGTEISSGINAQHTIQSISLTQAANRGTELTLGSVCSDALEAKFFTPNGNLNITVGTEVTLYRESEDGARKKVGMYTLEKPKRPSKNTYQFIAYDRVSWLDRDLTDWLASLDGWPYSLLTLAQMVCDECLLNLITTDIPNKDFPVNKFPATKITGREIMGYIGQIAARFCRATSDGDIEFAWYENTDITLEPSGDRYFFTLAYEDYQVEKIDAVQVQLADAEYGMLWPEKNPGENSYVITYNPLITKVNADLLPYLETIWKQIEYSVYTPCRITLPASLDLHPGQIVRVFDGNGHEMKTYIMSLIQKGQKATIESTGSARRDTPTSTNNKTVDDYVEAALKRQNQLDIFNKLTNYGAVEGIFLEENGQIYINATYLSTGILQSKNGSTFYLDLDEGILKMDAKEIRIGGKNISEELLDGMTQEELVDILTANGAADGIFLKEGQLYINAEYIITGTLNASLIKAGVLKSNDDGETFLLDLDKGIFNMSGTGKFMAPDKKSYITVDGGSFVLYAQDANERFIDIARIGFSEDSDGVDYPYVIFGHADNTEEENRLTLIKSFGNGIFVGNSVPKLSTGNFIGLPGAVGFFVDTVKQKTFNVVGEEMFDAFTAVFG